jgi:hypothetical protein
MARKIKKKQKISFAWIAKTVSLIIGFAVLAAICYVTANHFIGEWKDQQLLREQKARLDSAEEDVGAVAANFLANFPGDKVDEKKFNKACGESSAKYGRGTIRCRTSFLVRIATNKTNEQLKKIEDTLFQDINERVVFSNAKVTYSGDSYLYGNEVFEVKSSYKLSEATQCQFTLDSYNREQYERASRMLDFPSDYSYVIHANFVCQEITKEPIYQLVN